MIEHLKYIWSTLIGGLFAYLSPTNGAMIALIVTFIFNILCGMQADGVTIIRCKNFSMKKITEAVFQLLMISILIQTLFVAMEHMGDKTESLFLIKTITYVFAYAYIINGLKNLIIAYPKNLAFKLIYHVLRFEFKKMLPNGAHEIIEKEENENGKD